MSTETVVETSLEGYDAQEFLNALKNGDSNPVEMAAELEKKCRREMGDLWPIPPHSGKHNDKRRREADALVRTLEENGFDPSGVAAVAVMIHRIGGVQRTSTLRQIERLLDRLLQGEYEGEVWVTSIIEVYRRFSVQPRDFRHGFLESMYYGKVPEVIDQEHVDWLAPKASPFHYKPNWFKRIVREVRKDNIGRDNLYSAIYLKAVSGQDLPSDMASVPEIIDSMPEDADGEDVAVIANAMGNGKLMAAGLLRRKKTPEWFDQFLSHCPMAALAKGITASHWKMLAEEEKYTDEQFTVRLNYELHKMMNQGGDCPVPLWFVQRAIKGSRHGGHDYDVTLLLDYVKAGGGFVFDEELEKQKDRSRGWLDE